MPKKVNMDAVLEEYRQLSKEKGTGVNRILAR
jgi:hypothetical protein